MPTVAAVISELKRKGTEQTRKTYARHGMAADRILGVSIADLKLAAKTIRGEQSLACELYETGAMEAMYLAGMVADGAQLTRTQLSQWAKNAAGLQMVSEYTIPWLAADHPQGRELALEWINSKDAHVAATGWSTYAGLLSIRPDDALDLKEIESLMVRVTDEIDSAPNRVRYTMNNFVIAVGVYVRPLLRQAKAIAKQLGTVKVDMGDTACKVPLASAAIEKIEQNCRIGQKRKTLRC